MLKIDLKNVFFQIPIHQSHVNFYGIYHRHQRYSWTRLPMGHAMAPSIMQRLAVAVARLTSTESAILLITYR
jgi:hypothetical protein